MDPGEMGTGVDESNFWHMAKINLIDSLLSKLGRKGMDILVVGCGTGNDLRTIMKFGRVTCCDINKKALDEIRQRIAKQQMDVTRLQFKENSFDAVLAFDVLEHIDDDRKAIDECRRVLRPGGHMIFTVPAWQLLFSPYDAYHKHKRRYNPEEIRMKFGEFKEVYTTSWNCLLFPFFAVQRGIERLGKNRKYVGYNLPPILNSPLFHILNSENWLIRAGLRLPIGLSICGIYKKPIPGKVYK